MLHRITFPQSYPYHQPITEIINTFAVQNPITAAYLNHLSGAQKYMLILVLSQSTLPVSCLKSKWISKAQKQFHTNVIVLAKADCTRHQTLGTLFMHRYMNRTNLVYENNSKVTAKFSERKQIKKFKTFKLKYYHTANLLQSEIQKAKNTDSLLVVYRLYITLFEHHIFHLEISCVGRYFDNETLDKRCIRLEGFLPTIQQIMLKKNSNKYFITQELYAINKADDLQDTSFLRIELLQAIHLVEQQLYQLVQKVFLEAKQTVKKLNPKQKPLIPLEPIAPYQGLIQILTKHFDVHEVFLYHQQQSTSCDQYILYVLIISNTINNQQLFDLMQMINHHPEAPYKIIPIAHSKIWIQEHLLEYQSFFQKIMIPNNSIYQAKSPTVIHWHHPYSAQYPDLDFYTIRYTDLYQQYTLMRDSVNQASEALDQVRATLIYRGCIMLLYASISYRPNHINFRIIWKLCEYAEPKIKSLSYLLSKLSFDFFSIINPHLHFYEQHKPISLSDSNIIDEILQNLIHLLHTHLKEKNKI